MDWTNCLLGLLAFVILTYFYLKRIHNHWKKQNVPFVPGAIPIFGHMLPSILTKDNIPDFLDGIYKSYNTSFVGFYFMQKPAVILRDPELVKCVLQSNFTSFNSNTLSLSEIHDPILSKNAFFTGKPDLWKIRRNGVSNNLTGKKLRHLSVIIQQACVQMTGFIDRKIQLNNGVYECELKETFLRYTGEIVANAAFGIQGQSFDDNPHHLSFTEVAKTLFKPSFINGLKQATIFCLPKLAEFLALSFLEKRTDTYLRENIKSILKQRQQSGISPNDFLKYCSESNSDLDSILGEISNFYLDVYETTCIAITCIFHSLAKNPDIQTKLRDHIRTVLKDNGNVVSYDSLKCMDYLDQVMYENLRCFPPLLVLMKNCNESINLTGSDGLTCQLNPGNPVFIPVRSLHMDDKYWPNPEVFDPDRFSIENQANNQKFTFLGFGDGPRMCVGKRLGQLLLKYITASLLLEYSIEPSMKTKVPLEIDPSLVLLNFSGGLWCKFKKLH